MQLSVINNHKISIAIHILGILYTTCISDKYLHICIYVYSDKDIYIQCGMAVGVHMCSNGTGMEF